MTIPKTWRKSSYSGGGQGDACVEIAGHRTRVAVRDSKDPAYGTLTFPTGAFVPFVELVKSPVVTRAPRFVGTSTGSRRAGYGPKAFPIPIVEDWHAELWLDDSDSVATYLRVWQTLRESAVYGADAQNVINAARRALNPG